MKGVGQKHAADKTANINKIDNVCGANNIVNVWKKYVSICNRGDFSCDKERLSTRLNDDCDNNVNDMVVSNCDYKNYKIVRLSDCCDLCT